MTRFVTLRLFGSTRFFAGFKQTERAGIQPIFVQPQRTKSVQASIIHEDDLPETLKDLAKFGCHVEPIRLG